jgi:hypothetical protein
MTDRVKYSRTMHLPWSPGLSNDDKLIESLDAFLGKRVIVSEKMDGENTTLYPDGYLHARSTDGRDHPSRDWVKAFWASRCHDLPQGWRVCGENLFAVHSVRYEGLPSYFFGFSIWDETNTALSWDETMEWFTLLGITPVPVLYDGIWDEALIRGLYREERDRDTREGYVVRVADQIPVDNFRTHVAKYVRAQHVQTDTHWMHAEIVRNGLA